MLGCGDVGMSEWVKFGCWEKFGCWDVWMFGEAWVLGCSDVRKVPLTRSTADGSADYL